MEAQGFSSLECSTSLVQMALPKDQRCLKESDGMKVQVLRGTDGKVIFLEGGSDFVEMMFKLMQSPLSSLLGVCPMNQESALSPLVVLRKSLSELALQSFAKGRLPDETLPGPIETSEIMKMKPFGTDGFTDFKKRRRSRSWRSGSSSSSRPRSKHRSRSRSLRRREHSEGILKDNCKFMVTDSLEVFESSTVKAMELMQGKVRGFGDIKTSSATVSKECVQNLIQQSLRGSRTVLSQVLLAHGCSATAK
ncbi:unnamed protein product [Durusdinium trenchii]|uniref:Uncharacterized protein n=1 Tax=Durusdinium trenchii TaxID=1381693 RepID=A0ABP0RR21_9DINO